MTRRRVAALALIAALATNPARAADPAAAGAAATSVPAVPTAERKALIDAVAKALTDGYVFPVKVAPIVARLRASERAGRYATLEPKALAEAMSSDIHAVVQDAHLAVDYSAEPIPAVAAGSAPSAAQKAQRDAFYRSVNYGVRKTEIMDGNVGYLLIEGFLEAGKVAPVIGSAMAFLANADALVIDLRGNHGGSPETVALVASYLVPAATHINDIYYREGNVTRQFWSNSIPNEQRIRADVPIFVLTDRKTASAGEELAYDLQQLKRATLIGEPTWGGANPGGTVRLADHFEIFVPGGRAINPLTKTNWEGAGVQPDVAVAGDQALAKALDLARAREPAKAALR